jgi:hypothetical protein
MSILVLTSDTLIGTPATGNLEYNGQFYGTDSNASRAQMQRITQGTAVASTSGTSIDFTGLPAWVKKITVMFSGVSTSGTNYPLIQLGYQNPVTSTGYVGSQSNIQNGSTVAVVAQTAGFGIYSNVGTYLVHGSAVITNITGNTWVCSGNFISTGPNLTALTNAGYIALSGTLDRVRITTVGGTDTFDAGTVNIFYEG